MDEKELVAEIVGMANTEGGVLYLGVEVLQIQIPMSKTIIATSDGKILRRRLKLDGTPENVPLYPYEIPGRLSSISQLDYLAQILFSVTIDDLDGNERDRFRNIIKYRKGDPSFFCRKIFRGMTI